MNRFDTDARTWTELNLLLDEALDLPVEERAAWLDALPAEHQHLQPRLKELLLRASKLQKEEFLNTLPKLDLSDGNGEGR